MATHFATVIATYIFASSMLPCPSEFSKEVDRITFSFIGQKKKSPPMIISGKSKGGLKMNGFGLFNTAIKAAWVKRFCSVSDAD